MFEVIAQQFLNLSMYFLSCVTDMPPSKISYHIKTYRLVFQNIGLFLYLCTPSDIKDEISNNDLDSLIKIHL